jgi:hypothetical protein
MAPGSARRDANWDRDWRPVASSDNDDGSDDEDGDEDEDFHEHGAQACVHVQAQPPLLLLVVMARSPARSTMVG